ncbi:hypothetical protein [Micromonospora sp. LOL_021]
MFVTLVIIQVEVMAHLAATLSIDWSTAISQWVTWVASSIGEIGKLIQ